MWSVLTTTNVDYTLCTCCRCWFICATTYRSIFCCACTLQEDNFPKPSSFFLLEYKIISGRHQMDKSNTSGCAAEDIIETRNYANSSLNPEALKHQSFPFPYTSPSGERKNFKGAANRGRKGSRVLSSRTYPLRSSKSIFMVVHFRSVVDKSLIDVVQTPTERAM